MEPNRRGFSAIDLLVVFAIIAILIALLLPAVQQAREAAKRVQCSNNLKQLALSAHNYHDTFRVFPPGHVSPPGDKLMRNMSAQTMLLPFLEQGPTYDRVNFHLGTEHPANTTSRSMKIAMFICASDPAPSLEWGGTNYPLLAGSTPSIAWNGDRQTKGPNGLAFQISKIYIGDIKDGSSRTMMAMEWTRGQAGLTSTRGAYAVKPGPLPDPLEENADRGDKLMFDRGASWMSGGFLQTLMTQTLPLNAKELDLSFGLLEGGLSAGRSYHAGGVNIMMCDGSVQFVSETIDRKVLDAMATRDGREAF